MSSVRNIIFCLLLASAVQGQTFVDTIQGANPDSCFDNKVIDYSATTNYGSATTLTVGNSSGLKYSLLKCTNIRTGVPVGYTIDSVVLAANAAVGTGFTIGMFEVAKYWYEGTGGDGGAVQVGSSSYNSWYHPDSVWGSAGINSTASSPTQNRCYSGSSVFTTALTSGTVATSSTWVTKDSALVSDNKFAYAASDLDALIITGFNFSIPTTAIITDITITYRGRYYYGTTGVIAGPTKDGSTLAGGSASQILTATNTTYTLLAPDALWETTFTPAEINASTFGVRIAKNGSSNTAMCDHVQVQVSYTNGGDDRGLTALDSETLAGAGWYRWNCGNTLSLAWYDATKESYGVVLRVTSGSGQATFYSSEYTTNLTLRPMWIVYSHLGGPSEEPCERTGSQADDCYDMTHRLGYVPDFEIDPDTVRAIVITYSADDGGAQYVSDEFVAASFDTLNRMTEEYLNIHFDYSIAHFTDSYWRYIEGWTTGSDIQKAFYILNSIVPDSQCHVFVYDDANYTWPRLSTSDIIKPISISGTVYTHNIAHEIGHRFWLDHTHVGVGDWSNPGENPVNCSDPCREWPQAYDSSETNPDGIGLVQQYLVGDMCADTKADPGFVGDDLFSLLDTVCQDSAFGVLRADDLMSYGNVTKQSYISPDQATIMRCILETYFPMWITND